MEQYTTNNKILNSLLEPVVLHLQQSNFKVQPNAFDALQSKINNITTSFKSEYIFSSMEVLMLMFNSFSCSKNTTPIEWRNFLMKLHDAVLEIDKMKVLEIEESISDSLNKIHILENTTTSKYVLSWFKDFCKRISVCISLIHKRSKEVVSENVSNHLLLSIVQLTTCIKLLFRLFVEEISNKMLITESRRFITKRFIYIFDGVTKILNDNNCPEQNPGFIQWMDNTLDLIAELDPNNSDPQNTENIKTSIEEVLCHAMSIAQICSEDDCKKIKASVQTVLHEFKQLEREFTNSSVNPSFANLSIDIVSDKLCILERRVNTAVLNISLKVFSDPLSPLKKLRKLCEDSETSILNRLEIDLDELVQNLDVHVDCMIQVGLFAIACSTNSNIVAKIRSCLASLESLECELIPALTSLYMEPSKSACLYANLFVKHWYEEVKYLRNDVCCIIDPVAFGQVIHDDFKINLENMQQLMTDPKMVLEKDMIIPLCENVNVLIIVVEASVKEMKILKESCVNKHAKNLRNVHREVLAAVEILSEDRKISERVLKRILILSSMIERIIEAFSKENNNCSQTSQSETLQESINPNDINLTKIINNISLKSLQQRGLEILKDRSILYKTPNKNTKLSAITPIKFTSAKKPENRKLGMSFVRKNVLPNCENEDNDTLDLQITEILEELSNLADTLRNNK